MEQDGKSKPKRGKALMPVIKAPQGNVKGIGKMGIYTGGLTPLVVGPISGLAPRRVSIAIGRVSGNDSRRKR
jgi:hypothetical protein